MYDSAKPDSTFVDDFASATTRSSTVDRLPPRENMRTFVFSATMSKDLQRNLKKKGRKYKPGPAEDGMSSLDDLLLKLDFRDSDPELIDLSPEGGIVETLKECKIECMLAEKVRFVPPCQRWADRCDVGYSPVSLLVEVSWSHDRLPLVDRWNSSTASASRSTRNQRRAAAFRHATTSSSKVSRSVSRSLHSVQAKLKRFHRFKDQPNTILLATDVAARGLDIPSVSHVVHYQLPRSADTYVHRSGRTARAGQEGLAVQFIAPEEKQMQRLLMLNLAKGQSLHLLE